METLDSRPRMEVIGEGPNARIIFHNLSGFRPSFTTELAEYMASGKDNSRRLVLNPISTGGRPVPISDFSNHKSSPKKMAELERGILESSIIYMDEDC